MKGNSRGHHEDAEESPSSSALDRSPAPAADFDTCYGALYLYHGTVSSSAGSPRPKRGRSQRVHLEVKGDIVLIQNATTGEYKGLVDPRYGKVLSKLAHDAHITLTGYMSTVGDLCVTMFGLSEHAPFTGDHLAENNMWLQQPERFEFAVPYSNPQSLSRPGMQLQVPVLHHTRADLDDDVKSRVQDILDKSSGPNTFVEANLSPRLEAKLMRHQQKAVAMMAEKERGILKGNEFPSLWDVNDIDKIDEKKKYYNIVTELSQSTRPQLCLGGILADDMGLGKTLSTLALVTASTDGEKRKAMAEAVPGPTLIVAPLATLSNWEREIKKHFKIDSIPYAVYHGPRRATLASSLPLNEVVFTTYDTLRIELSVSDSPLFQDAAWHRVVLDEAHVIRNQSSKGFKAVKMLHATYRWCLTGTPIQNRIEDFGALVDFLQIHPFDNASIFRQEISMPINKEEDSGYLKLARLFRAISLRRVKTAVHDEIELRGRREILERIQLDAEEREIYDIVRNAASKSIVIGKPMQSVLQAILKLRQISNHGRALLSVDALSWLDKATPLGLTNDTLSETCESCFGSNKDPNFSGIFPLNCLHQICHACCKGAGTEESHGASMYRCLICSPASSPPKEESTLDTFTKYDNLTNAKRIIDPAAYRPSSKVKALIKNLLQDKVSPREDTRQAPKSVVFSSWKKMLDLVDLALQAENLECVRVDGSKTRYERDLALQTFRSNSAYNVLLATIGSAGVGIDLSIASRVHILEPQWNPMAERQALDRVYRIGQDKEVISFRYLATGMGSIDEYILKVQQRKMGLIESSFGSGDEKYSSFLKNLAEHLQGFSGAS